MCVCVFVAYRELAQLGDFSLELNTSERVEVTPMKVTYTSVRLRSRTG